MSVRPWPCPACKRCGACPTYAWSITDEWRESRLCITCLFGPLDDITRPAHHHPAASTEESTK